MSRHPSYWSGMFYPAQDFNHFNIAIGTFHFEEPPVPLMFKV